jgi:precorrin isomerase
VPTFDVSKRQAPIIHDFYKSPVSPNQVEAASFDIIDRETPAHGFSAREWVVVRRMIHTCADPGLIGGVRFSTHAISDALEALRAGAPIYVDANMIKAGLSIARLSSVHPNYRDNRIFCHVADPDVAQTAKREGLPRSIFAVRKAKETLHNGIAVFGNAPLGLLELNRMIVEEGVRPAFVVAMPVGFVHVVESKEEFVTLAIPYIAVMGRRGGSALAVSVIHALCTILGNNEKG